MPLFITLEGGEGCGKTTQAKLLFRRLSKAGYPAFLVHEPGGTPLGAKLRRLLKGQTMTPQAELLLFAAARAELVQEVVQPTLAQGKIVISDRYSDSTIAYQGYGRGLDKDYIQAVNHWATGGLKPDLAILLDIPVPQGLARKGENQDRFEGEELAFHQRVRQGYLALAWAEPSRWFVVDATQPQKRIAQAIWERVSSLLPKAK